MPIPPELKTKMLAEFKGQGAAVLTHACAVFDLIPIVEEEMVRARLPGNPSTFMLLQPPTEMVGRAKEVYRSHVREILDRVRAGEDTRLGTEAEVLCVLLDFSLTTPPGAQASSLTEHLFERVFGRLPRGVTKETGRREPWDGACAEMLLTLRRKAAVQGRR